MGSVFDVVKTIIDRKKNEKRRPLHALDREIEREYVEENLQKELDKLVSVRILVKGRTINNDYYRINGMSDD
ncbi:hypothetical protein LJC45_05675 [Alistipes sp. OttesenSCG-928-B03]|nr:hypothetical protein [Alistipes sp. OttesenSCG-928-B03]